MATNSLKEKTARGLLWGGLSSGLQQVLNLCFGIVLARLLTQSDYGMVGMLSVFVLMAGALQEGGFISALNKRTTVTQADYTSVFWFNIIVSLSIYAVLFACAPLIARFYGEPALTPLSRYVFAGFVVSSFNIVPRAKLFRELKVKQTTQITLTALAVAGIVGIGMAWQGYAYWGLATQSIVYAVMMTVQCYALTGWRPDWKFTWTPVREMFGFSSRLIVTNLFQIVNQNLFSILLGRFYGAATTGNFTQANKWNTMGHTFVTQMLQSVSQPVFARLDDKAERLQAFRKLLRFTSLFAFPAMFGLALVTPEFIVLALGAKWHTAVPYLQLLCLWGAFVPVQSLYTNLLIARGRSDLYMYGTIALALIEIAAALAARPLGIFPMLAIFVAVNLLWTFFWHYHTHREIGLRLTQAFRDVAPYLLLSLALCGAVALWLPPFGNLWLRLAAKVLLVALPYGAVLYLSGSVIFREGLSFLLHRKG